MEFFLTVGNSCTKVAVINSKLWNNNLALHDTIKQHLELTEVLVESSEKLNQVFESLMPNQFGLATSALSS